MTADLRVNGVYPLSYFNLPKTQQQSQANPVFWASASRYASVDSENPLAYLSSQSGGVATSEILHLDYGRTREINYLTLDMLRLPVNIKIEYDALSVDTMPSSWTSVTPHEQSRFDSHSQYDSNLRNPWLKSEFSFTDSAGETITTRHLRITFTRRDEAFPTPTTTPFAWPVVVKSLRSARLISEYADTRSTLISSTSINSSATITSPVSQTFQFDSSVVRGDLVPNVMGFAVLAQVNDPNQAALAWTLSNESGIIDQTTTSGAPATGSVWMNWSLDRGTVPIVVGHSLTLTVQSLTPSAISMFETTTAYTSPLSSSANPIALRVFADVADSGQDVLGNAYRSAVVIANPEDTVDPGTDGWVSAPQPAADAVESLYMDVRNVGSPGDPLTLGVIDAVKVAPLTPGAYMNVYYTQTMLASRAPNTTEEWEAVLWTPINQTFVLRGASSYELPSQIQASFVKLEFSNLRPRPYEEPNGITMPPVQYKRYPSWVQAAFSNSSTQTAANQFLPSRSLTTQALLDYLVSPVDGSDQYSRADQLIVRQKHIQSQSSTQQFGQGSDAFNIDPTTASKISFNTPGIFQNALPALTNQDNLLGRLVAKRYSRNIAEYPIENIPAAPASVRTVSSLNNRANESLSQIAPVPMWFNRQCLHQYQVTQASFNGKAYYIGIKSVEFQRFDFTVTRDDALIEDSLYDSTMLDAVTFETLVRDTGTQIASAASNGTGGYIANVYVDYIVNGTRYQNEPLALAGANSVELSNVGVATNIAVKSQIGSNGIIYLRGEDYDVGFHTNASGTTVTTLARSYSGSRLVVPHSADSGFQYVDGSFVVSGFEGYGTDLFNPPLPYAEMLNPSAADLSYASVPGHVGAVRTFFQGYALNESHIRSGDANNPGTDLFTHSDTNTATISVFDGSASTETATYFVTWSRLALHYSTFSGVSADYTTWTQVHDSNLH